MPAVLQKPDVNMLAKLQGIYWFVTGTWPFIHLSSFIWVTGPKNDIWLLYTVSVLIAVIGGVLLMGGIRKQVTVELKWLGVAGAAGLVGIDVFYSFNDVISNVYLLDAAAGIILIILWFWAGDKGISKHNPNY